jgi:hypothetical protein
MLDELREILEREPGPLSAERVVELVCQHFGGQRVYVTQRPKPEISHKDTPRTIQRRYNVSRSTAHSWLCRWRNQRSSGS